MNRLLVRVMAASVLAAASMSVTLAGPPASTAAVWQPGMQFIRGVHQACDSQSHGQFASCYFAQMKRYGAPPQAVRFSRWLADENDGMLGFLRDFRHDGCVNIAYAFCPFRANENEVWLLVNGRPRLIDVDNLRALPQYQLKRNAEYEKLARTYPGIDLRPGDRGGTQFPLATKTGRGAQRFVVSYYLQNVCHACARLGVARFAFHFSARGKFLGAKLVSVRPIPQHSQ